MMWAVGAAVVVILYWLLRPAPKSKTPRIPQTPADSFKSVSWDEAMKAAPHTGARYLVVGVGFVGSRLVKSLLDRGEKAVRVFDIAPNPFAGDARVQYVRGDVTKLEQLREACKDIDTVYSTFAVIRFWERLPHQAGISERVNVQGTANLVEACTAAGVKNLVYTSTAHVNVNPAKAKENMTEADPYVTRSESHNHYTWSKAEAEKIVLRANGLQGLRTCAVRPCSGVFGDSDVLLLEPALRDNRSVLVVPDAKYDIVYVDNVVYGHLLAEAALRSGKEGVAGEAFCVSNEEPVRAEDLYVCLKHYMPQLQIIYAPRNLILGLTRFVETLAWVTGNDLRSLGDLQKLTPAMVLTAGMSYTFDCSKARKVLGYKPVYTFDQGVQKSIHDYRARAKAAA